VTPPTRTGRVSSWLSWKISGSLGSSGLEVKPGSGFSGNLCDRVHLPRFYVVFIVLVVVILVVVFICIEVAIFVVIEVIVDIIVVGEESQPIEVERERCHAEPSAGFAGSGVFGFAGGGYVVQK
jgi:predicted MFS family arabinose efflux permease